MNDQISGYYLDREQQAIVLDNSKYLLVVAGAGSGKTLTILGKIHYLLKYQKINPNKILCISFTKKAADSLKDKIKNEFHYDIPVYTFHKLSLEILKEQKQSYEIADSNLLENMIHKFFTEIILSYPRQMKLILNYFKIKKYKNVKKSYLSFYQNNQKLFLLLENLLSTFIHLLKCNHYSLEDFPMFLKKVKRTFSYSKYKKEKIFLILSLNLYLLYQEYLEENGEIDFDDMIQKATEVIHNQGSHNSYQYIIIDEYQDTSYIRFTLVKKILEKTNAKLMVVGDDFQSIYRFTGCDLSLFIYFTNYFKDAKIMKIQNTYRNSQELIKVAGDFVMKNKKQISKELCSHKTLEKPIQIIYYHNLKECFKKLIMEIYQSTKKSILVLGRNNKDIQLVLDKCFELKEDGTIIYKLDTKIKLYYLTAHKSKGLEEENVIIINLVDSYLGFPNQIKDDKVLRLVSKNREKYPYSEERRLFYVALTRTKNYVYLLVPFKNPSIFVTELIHDYPKMINIQNKKEK